jgi:hypothetical protein
VKRKTDWPSDGFAQLSAIYSRMDYPDAARRAFEKVREAGEIPFEKFMANIRTHLAAWRADSRDTKHIPNLDRFLEKGGYRTRAGGGDSKPELALGDPSKNTTAQWVTILRQWHRTGQWPSDHWGPIPGEAGCFVPPELLDQLFAVSGSQGALAVGAR